MITHRRIDSANNNRRQTGGCKQRFFSTELVTGVQANRLAHCWHSHHASLAHLPHKRLSWLFSFVFALPWSVSSLDPCLFVFFRCTPQVFFSLHSLRIFSSCLLPDERVSGFHFPNFIWPLWTFFWPLASLGNQKISCSCLIKCVLWWPTLRWG